MIRRGGGCKKQLEVLERYCSKRGMNVNWQTSKVVVFRNGRIIKKIEKWCYKDKFLNIVSNYKYLGIVFSCLLKWNMAHDALAKEATKTVINLQKLESLCNGIPCSRYFSLVDKVVLPI